jgi:NADH:ubiquinone oxidoreductase subunit 5 (subunit L)/multisubunit Na+/H+ antiporter MnhA subunit
MLGLVVTTGAVAIFERMTGSDNYHERKPAAHPVVGLLWAIGIAALFGLPPFWGFWPHLWFFQALAATQPWMLVPVAAGLALTSLALLVPLGRVWMGGGVEEVRLSWLELAPLMLIVLIMLVLGIAPWLVWDGWLRSLPMAPVAIPVDTTTQLVATLTGLALVGITVGLIRARSTRLAILDPDEQPVALAPDALGGLLQPLARLGDSALLLRGLRAGLLYVSRTLRLLIGLFEHNYYLMGVLAALIVLMLLMAQ